MGRRPDMERIEEVADLRRVLAPVRADGRRIGLVPTMGALHRGHLSHVPLLLAHADLVVMSVFVNPLQFGPGEDFERYPRSLEDDAKLAEEAGVDLLFCPQVTTLYPPGSETLVELPDLSSQLEGAVRPTHFRGVATVVAKLLNIVRPDLASFGQKDLQQLLVVRRLVSDLHFDVQILAVPTAREPDGLALSSRNAYLGADDRREAAALNRACRAGFDAVAAGERAASRVEAVMAEVLNGFPRVRPDYAVVRRLDDLKPMTVVSGRAAVLVAARVGSTRLLDNLVMDVTPDGVREIRG